MSVLRLIATRNYISTNKILMKCLGLYEAVILGELCSEQDYFEENNLLTQDGYFYVTVAKLEDNTTLKEDVQRRTLKHLCTKGIIDVQYKGLPKQRFIKINEQKLIEILTTYIK